MATKGIDPQLKYIGDYLKIQDDNCFVIPEYQRGYSWSIPQCDKLWQDIKDFLDSDSTEPYFFGTVILDCSNPNGELHLIDGQQRTTTFLLLLKALLDRLNLVLKNFSRTDNSEELEQGLTEFRNLAIDILYQVSYKKRTAIFKDWSLVKQNDILVNRSINEPYKDELKTILCAKTFDEAEANCYKIPRKQKDNKYTNFFRNYKFFYKKLEEECSESNLNNFVEGFLTKCQIIEIRSWQTEQAITMFNSLNSTGLPLSDADIISAQMYSNAGDNREQFNDEWQQILSLSSDLCSRGIVSIDNVLQEYMYIYRAWQKDYVNGNTVSVTTPGLRRFYITDNQDLLKNPLDLCCCFFKIASIWDYIKDFSIVKLLLKFNDNIKLYLIDYLFFRYDDVKEIKQEDLFGISECLLRLFTVLELVDAGYSSSNFKTFLFGEAIKLVDKNISIEEIEKDFSRHIQKEWTRESIKQSISDYNKNILVYLNEYLFAKEKSLDFNIYNSLNIEHIMPASGHNIEIIRQDAKIDTKEEFDSIVNKLGNKILLEEDINKSVSNDWFATKKQKSVKNKMGYKDSQYLIAQALTTYPKNKWSKEDIEIATEKNAERIVNFIWNENIEDR